MTKALLRDYISPLTQNHKEREKTLMSRIHALNSENATLRDQIRELQDIGSAAHIIAAKAP